MSEYFFQVEIVFQSKSFGWLSYDWCKWTTIKFSKCRSINGGDIFMFRNIIIMRKRNLESKFNVKFLIQIKYQNGFQTSFAVRIRGFGADISNMFRHFQLLSHSFILKPTPFRWLLFGVRQQLYFRYPIIFLGNTYHDLE